MLSSLWSPSKHRVCYYCNQLRSDSPAKPLKPKANLLRTPSQRGPSAFSTSSPPLTLRQYPIQWHCKRCESWNIWDERDQIVDAYNVLQVSGSLDEAAKPSLGTPYPRPSCKSDPDTADVLSGDDSCDGRGSSPTPIPKTTARAPAFEFCPACSQNQYIVMQALSDYIPDEDDPTYMDRVNSVEAYRLHMEQRYPPALAWVLIWVGTNMYFYTLRAAPAESDRPIQATIADAPTIELGHFSFNGQYLTTQWLPWDTLVATIHEWQDSLQVDLVGLYGLLATLVTLNFDPTWAYMAHRHIRSTARLARFRRCQLGSIVICLLSILPVKLNFPDGADPPTSSTPGSNAASLTSRPRSPSPVAALSRQASAADTETSLSRLQLLSDDNESRVPQLMRTYTPPPRLDANRPVATPFATTRWEVPTPTPKPTVKTTQPTTLPFLRSGTSWSTQQQPPPFNLNSHTTFGSQSPAPQARPATPHGFGLSSSNRSLSPAASLWRTPSVLPSDWSRPSSPFKTAAPVFPKRPWPYARRDSGQWFEPDRMTTTGSVTGLEDLFNETVRLADNFGITGSRVWLRRRWQQHRQTFCQWWRRACTPQAWQWWSSDDARWWSRWLALGLRTLTLNSLWARMMFLTLVGYWTILTTVTSCSWLFWSIVETCGIISRPTAFQPPLESSTAPARLFSAPTWSKPMTPNRALTNSPPPSTNLSARRPKNHLHIAGDKASTDQWSLQLRAWLTQGAYRVANYSLGLLSLTLATSLLIELASYTQVSNSAWLTAEPYVAWQFWQHLEQCQVSPPLDASSTSVTVAAPLDPNILAQSVLQLNYVLQALVHCLESPPASSLLAWLAYPIQLYLHTTARTLWQPYYGAICVWLHSRAIQSLVLLATVADFFWIFTL
ncbi:hypothetical protein H4R35_003633 [Dimargaris xerosporica]|nr:hypothetical protein H4R35_003633 [Dimargaris xerosporica]